MATTNNTRKNTNTSQKTQSSGKGKRKEKNSSDDTLKFLLVLIIAGIAIALIVFSRPKENPADNPSEEVPTPTVSVQPTTPSEGTENANPTGVPGTPSQSQTGEQQTQNPPVTDVPEPTVTVPSATVAPTTKPEPTPTPTPVLSVSQAEQMVAGKVDTSLYDVQLFNENLVVGNSAYYQFGAIKNQQIIAPFLVVGKADGILYFYDSTEETVFDFTKFPLQAETTATPTPTPVPVSRLSSGQAYEVLCSYSKEALHIAREVREYDAEYDDELTLVNGVDCYRFNLSEFSNGKVRNRGEFYVSVDGTKCYYIDSDTNEFVQAVK